MTFELFEEKETGEEEIEPTFEEIIKRAFEGMAREMRVSMPAKVLKYDKDKRLADVQPVFKRKYRDGKVEDSPVIYNVPVAHNQAGNSFVHMPLKEGHSVMLVFQDRSLEKWISSGGVHDPEDTRAHHISDAIAYPGGYPSNEPLKINNPDDLIIGHSDGKDGGDRMEFRFKEDGKLQILNRRYDYIELMDDLIQVLRDAVVYTDNGPQKLRHAEFEALHQKFKTFVHKG